MVDTAALRAARPDALDEAARFWQQASTVLDDQIGAWKSGVIAPLRDDWRGRAADAADAALNLRARDLIATREYADAMAAVMRDAATGIGGAQALLRTADDLAAAHGLVIGNDGTATWRPSPLTPGGVVTRVEELFQNLPPGAAEATATAQRALALADETDQQVTARLQAIGQFDGASTGNLAPATAMLASAGGLGVALAGAAIPPKGTSPAAISAWWKDLPAAEQQRLISEDPSQIGWLDGLPATARDAANRLAMNRERTQVQAELQAMPPEPARYITALGPHDAQRTIENPAWTAWHDRVAPIQAKLDQITALDTGMATASAAAGKNNVFLLGFDTNGNGHAIVAVGNPDTAANTVTYVPGLGSHLAGSAGDITRATNLWQQTTADAPGQATSSVYWLGYNAPQLGASQGVSNFDVTSTHDAVAGGSSLSRFQAGLGASHQPGTPPHSTVIGHSYGSVVVGEAAARSGMRPDDIIFVGSPGVGVAHAAQLGIPPSHVWAGAISQDPVPGLSNPAYSLAYPDSDWFGNSPVSGAFGGQVFNCDDPGISYPFPGLAAHSAYWTPGSSSLQNMANIVAGNYGSVHTVPALPVPPDPESTTPLGPGGI